MSDPPAPPARRRRRVRRERIALAMGCVLLLAGALRLLRLADFPGALFRDELEKGYTAWELWETGRYGKLVIDPAIGSYVRPSELLPAFVDVYGVRTSALYQYASAPWVGLLGLSAASTRLAAALAGVLTVGLVMLWVRRQWGSATALAAGVFLALSPWHLTFSRWAQQGIFVPLFLAGAMLALALALSHRATPRTRWLGWLAAGGCAAGAFYAYEVARLFVPLWALLWIGAQGRRLRDHLKPALAGAALFLALAIPVAVVSSTPEGRARFQRISVFSQEPDTGAALAHAARNYASHFDPRFLFLSGDANLRHNISGLGLLHIIEVPGFLFGLWILVRRRKPADLALLGWVVLYPVSSSLTDDGSVPHALRAITGLPALHVLSAVGSVAMLRAGGFLRCRAAVSGPPEAVASTEWMGTAGRAMALIALIAIPIVSLQLAARTRGPLVAIAGFERPYEDLTRALLAPTPEETAAASTAAAPAAASPRYLTQFVPYAPHYLLFWGQVHPADWQQHGIKALPAQLLPLDPSAARQLDGAPAGTLIGILQAEIPRLPRANYDPLTAATGTPNSPESWAVIRKR